MNEDREERIRQRAYRLWQEEGSPEGRADEYWSRAQAQIDAEGDDEGTAPAAPSDQSGKRRAAGVPLQENGALPSTETSRDTRRR